MGGSSGGEQKPAVELLQHAGTSIERTCLSPCFGSKKLLLIGGLLAARIRYNSTVLTCFTDALVFELFLSCVAVCPGNLVSLRCVQAPWTYRWTYLCASFDVRKVSRWFSDWSGLLPFRSTGVKSGSLR
eukprot:2523181-Amphidinium_carterae.1